MTGGLVGNLIRHIFVVFFFYSQKGQIYFLFNFNLQTSLSLWECNWEYLARHLVSRHMSRRRLRRLVKRHVYLRFEQKPRNGVWRAKHNHSSRFVPYSPVAHIRDRKNNHQEKEKGKNGSRPCPLAWGRVRGIGAFTRPSSRLVGEKQAPKKKDETIVTDWMTLVSSSWMIRSSSDMFDANGLKVFSSDDVDVFPFCFWQAGLII